MERIQDVQWGMLRHFDRAEFSAPDLMSWDLLVRLDAAREDAGVPFVITSSFRAGDPGAHGKGYAADISCEDSRTRRKMIDAMTRLFTRIGVYQRHIHVDVDPERPQGVLWYGRYHPETLEGVTWKGGDEDATQEDD